MADKKNAVAEQKTAEIVQFDPSMFEADAGTGLENMGQDDLALPFLKILGGMSKELDDLEDARKGDILQQCLWHGLQGQGRHQRHSGSLPASVHPMGPQRRRNGRTGGNLCSG
jgi:hypothetical protein